MTKAKFTEQQDSVKIIDGGESVYVFICINGEKKSETVDGNTDEYWEYDYNEFVADKNKVDISDVIENPEKYIDYIPADDTDSLEQLRADVDFIAMEVGVDI